MTLLLARVIGALVLARLDGDSPVNFLDELDVEEVRRRALRLAPRACADVVGAVRSVAVLRPPPSMNPSRIASSRLRQILDSRGRPTVEADVILNDGSLGRASVPSGASTGKYEARELRDGDADCYEGYGVQSVVANAQQAVRGAVAGRRCARSVGRRCNVALDRRHPNPGARRRQSHPGIIARDGASSGSAYAPASVYLSQLARARGIAVLPMPMTNILSGGAHANGGMDFQDFLAVPMGATTYRKGWNGSRVYAVLLRGSWRRRGASRCWRTRAA